MRKHWKRCRECMGQHLCCWQRAEAKISSSRYCGQDLGQNNSESMGSSPTYRPHTLARSPCFLRECLRLCVAIQGSPTPTSCPASSFTFALRITLLGPKQTMGVPAHTLLFPMPVSFRPSHTHCLPDATLSRCGSPPVTLLISSFLLCPQIQVLSPQRDSNHSVGLVLSSMSPVNIWWLARLLIMHRTIGLEKEFSTFSSREWFALPSPIQGTFGIVWRPFWLSQLWGCANGI